MNYSFRSGFERTIAKHLRKLKIPFRYEEKKLGYIIPTERHHYITDFTLKNGVILETKGKLTLKDRKKFALLREQYPDTRICLLFMNAYNKLYAGSPTTYAKWAENHDIEWADWKTMGIPKDWIKDAR